MHRHWQRSTAASHLLLPLSWAYRGAVALRRFLYANGLLPATRLPVPVVVVGNIAVGGTGKTPLVLWLADMLRERGLAPGIVSRGYGGTAAHPLAVGPDSDPRACGDEPLLLAQRSRCPVWVGRDRPRAARALLAAHPECNIIISDDGLQHYALARVVEIAVVDGVQRHGNGRMLPAGPLREPPQRLDSVDAVVVNGGAPADTGPRVFAMQLQPREFINLLNPAHRVTASHFHGETVHAVAGIGYPPRFFAQLQRLGMTFEAHAFADHHPYAAADITFPDDRRVVMTEKDAVKCRAFATERHWALRVDAEVGAGLAELILQRIGHRC